MRGALCIEFKKICLKNENFQQKLDILSFSCCFHTFQFTANGHENSQSEIRPKEITDWIIKPLDTEEIYIEGIQK